MKQISDELYLKVRDINNKYALLISGISNDLEYFKSEGLIDIEQHEILSDKFEQSAMHDVYELARAILDDVQKNEVA